MKEANNKLVGIILSMPLPEVAEMVVKAGYDWAMIDMEHSTLNLEQVQRLVMALQPSVQAIVRVPANDETWIKQVLDTGCDGIMVPMVNSVADAERAVRAAHYPPSGIRSVGVTRAHGYGPGFSDYVFNRSRDIVILAQAENIEAVKNIDSIVSTSGLSAIFIGPYDLSASMAKTGEVNDPEVRKAIGTIKESCNKIGLPWGIFGMTPSAVQHESGPGCKWVLCGIDSTFLSQKITESSETLRDL